MLHSQFYDRFINASRYCAMVTWMRAISSGVIPESGRIITQFSALRSIDTTTAGCESIHARMVAGSSAGDSSRSSIVDRKNREQANNEHINASLVLIFVLYFVPNPRYYTALCGACQRCQAPQKQSRR